MNRVSRSIKKFRTAKGMTQNDLAEKLFVSRQTVSSWENGRTQPDIDFLEKLAEALSVSIEELIYGEKPKLVDDGKNEKARKTMMIIFSVLASLLVSVGGVLVFVNYWYEFPTALKMVFSVLPMLIGQALAVWVFKNKFESVQWKESSAIVWCAGIAATVALCDSVLNLSTSFSACALIDAVLFLPVIYIFGAVSPLTVYYILSFVYGISSLDVMRYSDKITDINYWNPVISVAATALLVFVGAIYVFLHRKESNNPRHIYSAWLTVIAFIGIAVFGGMICDEMFAVPILSGLMLLYTFKDKGDLLLPIRTLVPLAISVVSVLLAYQVYDGFYYDGLELYGLIVLILAGITATVSFVLSLKAVGKERYKLLYPIAVFVSIAFALVCIMFELSKYTFVGCVIMFALVMFQGVSLFVVGAKENRFLPLNVGLITVLAVLTEIIFAWEVDTLIMGFIMMLFGVVLFAVNFQIARANKKGQQTKEVSGDE